MISIFCVGIFCGHFFVLQSYVYSHFEWFVFFDHRAFFLVTKKFFDQCTQVFCNVLREHNGAGAGAGAGLWAPARVRGGGGARDRGRGRRHGQGQGQGQGTAWQDGGGHFKT